MDLYTLDENFYLDEEVVGFESLIWTERFRESGDFSLKTSLVDETLDLIPSGSCLGILDSKQVMFVETHEISIDDDGNKELTISGRTFDGFLQYRTNAQELGYIVDGLTVITASDELVGTGNATWAIIVVGNSLGGIADPKDVVSNVAVSHNVFNQHPISWRKETLSSNLLTRLVEMMDETGLGVKIIRPQPPETTMTIMLYDGIDRSPQVIFDSRLGHFEINKYLKTIRDTYTVAYGRSDKVVGQRYLPGTEALSGLDRRVLYVDCLDIKEDTNAKEMSLMSARMDAALLAAKPKGLMLDCTVSPDIPQRYNVDYFLGDTVRCVGEYGITQKMIVAEYIRACDANGDLGYPTLALPTLPVPQTGGLIVDD